MQLVPQLLPDELPDPPLEPPLEPPLDEPLHGQPDTHVCAQQHAPAPQFIVPSGCPEQGLPPLLLPLDPPELLPEHTHDPHVQLLVHVSVPLPQTPEQPIIDPGAHP